MFCNDSGIFVVAVVVVVVVSENGKTGSHFRLCNSRTTFFKGPKNWLSTLLLCGPLKL